MRTAWAIYKRELIGTFCSPLAYVVMVAFLVFNGVVFWFFMSMTADNPALTGSRSPLQMFFGSTILSVLTLLVFSPATTMRTFAEERRSRTFETLFTAPVTDVEVVAGKYFGSMTFYAALWAPTLLYALVVALTTECPVRIRASRLAFILFFLMFFLMFFFLQERSRKQQCPDVKYK